MDKLESEIKRAEVTINDIAEKLELVSNTNMLEKEPFRKLVAKDLMKNKMITVAVEMFVECEKKLNKTNQKIKGCEDYVVDMKI